jgi:hypothetical protein
LSIQFIAKILLLLVFFKSQSTIKKPLYFEINEDAEQLKKVDLFKLHTAFASKVLPVPGGPNNSTPFLKLFFIFIYLLFNVAYIFILFAELFFLINFANATISFIIIICFVFSIQLC